MLRLHSELKAAALLLLQAGWEPALPHWEPLVQRQGPFPEGLQGSVAFAAAAQASHLLYLWQWQQTKVAEACLGQVRAP